MFTHLSRLFSNKSRLHGRAQARRCQTRPQVEVLEGRQLLSTTSAITWHYGTYVQRDLFAIDLQSRLAVEYTSDNSGTNSFFLPSGPGQITAVSAGLGAGGNPEVYVLAA